jgi:hypothetical protein
MDREEYSERRRSLDFEEIQVGTGGVDLFPADGLDAGQEGYAGEHWPENWLVIGTETSMGDPIILDCESGKVLQAAHGQGDWESHDDIAESIDGFFAILDALAVVSEAEGPDKIDGDPLPREDLDRFLDAVKKANPELDPWWWVSMIYHGEDPPPPNS